MRIKSTIEFKNLKMLFIIWLLSPTIGNQIVLGQKLIVEGESKIRGRLDLSYNTDETSMAVGYSSGIGLNTANNRYDTFIGAYAGFANTNGNFNTANGAYALYYNILGNGNTAFGYLALFNNLANNNTAVGVQSLRDNTNGFENSALGYQAGMSNQSGNWNTFLGSQAGRDFVSGDNNIFIGQGNSLERTTGSNNVMIGHSAGRTNNGSNNVFIGDNAGRINQGSNNIIIGASAAINESVGSDMLWIENSSSSTPLIFGDFSNDRLGINCTNPQAALSVTGDIMATGMITTSANACFSDRRYKKDIRNLESALNKVLMIRPVRYTWRKKEFPEFQFSEDPQIGFIAQELENIYPEFVQTGENGFKALDYGRLTVVLTKALQELLIKYNQLEHRLAIAEKNKNDLLTKRD